MKIKNLCPTCGGRLIKDECPYCGNVYKTENTSIELDFYRDTMGCIHRDTMGNIHIDMDKFDNLIDNTFLENLTIIG